MWIARLVAVLLLLRVDRVTPGDAAGSRKSARGQPLPTGTFELFRVAVSLTEDSRGSASGAPLLASLHAAIVRVKFPSATSYSGCPFRYGAGGDPRNGSTDSLGGDAAGLTRLVCDVSGGDGGENSPRGQSFRIFESFPISPHEKVLRRIIPLDGTTSMLDSHSPLARLLQRSATAVLRDQLSNFRCPEEFAAVFPLEIEQQVIDTASTVQTSKRQILPPASIGNCVLRFLAPGEQVRSPPVELFSYAAANESDIFVPFRVVGDVPLAAVEHAPRSSTAPSRKSNSPDRSIIDYVHYRRRLIRRASRIWEGSGGSTRKWKSHDNETVNMTACIRMPPSHLGFSGSFGPKATPHSKSNPGVTALAETAAELFVEGEESMAHALSSLSRIGMLTPDLGGVIMGPMKDIAKDFSQMAAGTMSEQASGVSESTSAGQVDQAMTEQITQLLSRGLKSHLTETLTTPLKETVLASVTGSTTQIFQSSLTRILTRDLRRPLTDKITDECAKQLPAKIDDTLPLHVSRLLTRDLNHLLTRSLPHALVPALVHTLTHSPMQDYYCYYCFHHKAFCQYCNYAPQQLYYALYYAGYYSNYYGDYFGDHVLRQFSMEALQKRNVNEEAADW